MQRKQRRDIALLLLFWAVGWFWHPYAATAQGTDTTRYRHYRPHDSTFRLTGTNIAHWSVVRDFKLDYTRHYQADSANIWGKIMRNPSTAAIDVVNRDYYRTMYDSALGPHPVKLITPVAGVGLNLKSVRCLENYVKVDIQRFHNPDIKDVTDWGQFDTTLHGLAMGIRAPRGSSLDGQALIAGGTRYVSQFVMFEGDSGIYRRLGLPGSFTSFRVSCAFRADSLTELGVGADEVIAWFIVYRRSRQGQHSVQGDGVDQCRCSAYVPIDTVKITAGQYKLLTEDVPDAPGYKDAGKTYELAVDRVVWKYDSLVYTKGPSGNYDVLESTTHFFERDTVIGRFYGSATVRDEIVNSKRFVVHEDSIFRTLVPLRYADPMDWLNGDGMEWFGDRTCVNGDTCVNRLNRGEFGANAVLMNDLYNSDLSVSFYSTRRVPITFLRTRVNQDLYDHLRAGRLDDDIIEPSVARMESDDTLRRILGRLAYSDETFFHKYRGDGEVARRIQKYMHLHGDTTQLWCNPPSNFEAFRVLVEDLGHTDYRTVHLIARQDYTQIGNYFDRLPIYYVDPDSMDNFSTTKTFRPVVRINDAHPHDTVNMILPNTTAAYDAYTKLRQFGGSDSATGVGICSGWGSYLDSKTSHGTGYGATITTLARAVDAAKFRFPQSGPPPQVWNSIQGMGWRVVQDASKVGNDTAAIYTPWASRPPTPPEMTAQAWLSLNCFVDGLVWTDAQIDAPNWGYVNIVSGKPTSNYSSWIPETYIGPTHGDTLKVLQPKMWTGFLDRYDAVVRVGNEIRRLDSIVHLTDMTFHQEQMSVHDTMQTFGGMPFIDTLMAEHSVRHDTDANGKPVFGPTSTYDARNETYIELSRFEPGSRDTLGTKQHASYYIVTNRRTWPIDNRHYGSLARDYGSDTIGFGAIDVRRPHLRMKNGSNVLVDSFLIEKVGHEQEWASRYVGVDDTVSLDWLEPGWGAMYRVSPVYARISQYGTFANNAVHSENPSTDAVKRDRIMVYERDSAVWLRVMDTSGLISKEWLVSDAADTVMKPGANGKRKRVANNFTPAIAVMRNDSSIAGTSHSDLSCMVVWERRDSTNKASVELMYVDTLPTRKRGMPSEITRHRLASARTLLKSWMQLSPAIVGVEKGYVVAWASPVGDGIEVIAVNDPPSPGQAQIDFRDTSTTVHAKFRDPVSGPVFWPGDTVAQFPTLAYRRNYDSTRTNGGTIYAPENPKDRGQSILGIDTIRQYHQVHLAYQQGARNNTSWKIMYNTIGVNYNLDLDANPYIPEIFVSKTEEVSSNIGACQYRHPSIAVDSALVGVAFESWVSTSSIVLRFRDTVGLRRQQPIRWRTPYYRWGDLNMVQRAVIPTRALRAYGWPSATQVPGLRKNQLLNVPEGSIVWQWTNAPNNRKNRSVFYRYGDGGLDTTLVDSRDPTMVLQSNLVASRKDAFRTSSIFHRGKDSLKFIAHRAWGDSAAYYPAFVVNTPLVPNATFRQEKNNGIAIVGTYNVIARADAMWSPCSTPIGTIRAGILLPKLPPTTLRRFDSVEHDPPLPVPPPPFDEWPVPPTFFPVVPRPFDGLKTLDDGAQLARTGDFRAGSASLTIRRVLMGSDSMVPWLNTLPYDTVSGIRPDIYFGMQLVRARDGHVLWMGDTISARRLGYDTIDGGVNVPVAMYAPADTVVYVRLFAAASPEVSCTVSGGFEFVEDESGAIPISLSREAPIQDVQRAEGSITVSMLPNPVRSDMGEVHMLLGGEGMASIDIVDLSGNVVARLPDIGSRGAGEYVVPVYLGDLSNGVYFLDVRMGARRGTVKFVVAR